MKKFNKNILVFVFCMLFVGFGLCSRKLYKEFVNSFQDSIIGTSSKFTKISKFENKIDKASSENLLYHSLMMDVNSIKENIMGTVVATTKEVVKTDSGFLISPRKKVSDEELLFATDSILELKTVSESNGSKFLYCAAPQKECYVKSPENVLDETGNNRVLFLNRLKQINVPCFDMFSGAEEKEFSINDFFYTDHHWKPSAGLKATKAICEELHNRFNYSFNLDYLMEVNYTTQTYKDQFLGSYGKRVGTYFIWSGRDDFEIITPKFSTSITDNISQTEKHNFESVMFDKTMLSDDYYNTITYDTYKKPKYHSRIIKNDSYNNGKKVLIIGDSFAQVVVPFFALQNLETHICDVRNDQGLLGEKTNLQSYIEEHSPDYVIVLYSNETDLEGDRYNFF